MTNVLSWSSRNVDNVRPCVRAMGSWDYGQVYDRGWLGREQGLPRRRGGVEGKHASGVASTGNLWEVTLLRRSTWDSWIAAS